MNNALADSWFMTVRHLRNLFRQPAWIAISLIQPVVWLLLYGALFRRIVEIPGFGANSKSNCGSSSSASRRNSMRRA